MKLINVALMAAMTLSFSLSQASTSRFEGKIVGGVEASIGEFPFIVSLQSGSGSHFCGGSLIKKNWVLTAAHCVRGGSVGRIVIGLHDRTDTRNAEIMTPKRIIAHPQYSSSTLDNDFALIELSADSAYAPVRLNDAEIDLSGADVISTTAGWGTVREGSSSLPTLLQKVDVPLVNAERCGKAYPNKITDRMICAGYDEGKKDSCQGDSGGPLIANDVNGQYLVGVVSWGAGCARPNKYGVYSKVNSMIDWINTNAM